MLILSNYFKFSFHLLLFISKQVHLQTCVKIISLSISKFNRSDKPVRSISNSLSHNLLIKKHRCHSFQSSSDNLCTRTVLRTPQAKAKPRRFRTYGDFW